MKVQLFTTLGCHLCEQAHAQLLALQADLQLDIESVEIADDDTLMERYGIRIPVVKTAGDSEIGWPFSIEELRSFLLESGP